MDKFTLSKQDVQDATKLLKETIDSFYKTKTVWEVISKNDSVKPALLTILDEANRIYKQQN